MRNLPEPIPAWADVMTVDEFVATVLVGGFIDDDGDAYYARDGQMFMRVSCVDLRQGLPLPEFTHIAWFNK